MPTPKDRRQYKTVNIPSDCETDPDRRFDLAILAAREMFRDYVVPCIWELTKDTGENITICRISNRKTVPIRRDPRVKCSNCYHRAAVKRIHNKRTGYLIVVITCPACHSKETINLSRDI